MSDVTFALPTLDNTEMTKNEQGALVVTQATAVIVAAFLDYAGKKDKSIGVSTNENDSITELINNVQNALKQF